jgi:hypothetical protein
MYFRVRYRGVLAMRAAAKLSERAGSTMLRRSQRVRRKARAQVPLLHNALRAVDQR